MILGGSFHKISILYNVPGQQGWLHHSLRQQEDPRCRLDMHPWNYLPFLIQCHRTFHLPQRKVGPPWDGRKALHSHRPWWKKHPISLFCSFTLLFNKNITKIVIVVCCSLVGKVPKKKLVRPHPDILPCLPLYLVLRYSKEWERLSLKILTFSDFTSSWIAHCFVAALANRLGLLVCSWQQKQTVEAHPKFKGHIETYIINLKGP